MLDIKFIRNNIDIVKNACKVKNIKDNIDRIIELDKRVRELKNITEAKTAEKNKITREIPNATDRAPLIAKSKEISEEIAKDLNELAELESELFDLLHTVPQIPSADTPIGKDDNDNVEVKRVGETPNFDFEPRAQWDLMDLNNWWMPEKIAEISGSRVYALRGELAELELAIQTYVIQKLIGKGFEYILVPSITKADSIFNAGHFIGSDKSVMDNDVFKLEGTDRCLAGTAEIVLNSLHSDEILKEDILPIKYAGFSPAFRKEAGAAGRDTRGLMRIHQFNKVEQYIFCKPEDSDEMHDLLLGNLAEVMEDLELPYRVIAACTGDMGFNKVKMHDIEAWVPSENKYRELGSCSSIGEFQARRTNTRYRENKTGEVKFTATLNNTGIALPRALIPVIENHQNADGSVNIPKKLQALMGGRTKIGGKK